MGDFDRSLTGSNPRSQSSKIYDRFANRSTFDSRVNINRRLTSCSLTGSRRQSRGVKNLGKIVEEFESPATRFRESSVVVVADDDDDDDDAEETDVSGSQSSFCRKPFFSFSLPLFLRPLFLFAVLRSSKGRASRRSSTRAMHHQVLQAASNQRHIFQRVRAARSQEERFLQLRTAIDVRESR